MKTQITFYFDYLCPFANRLSRFLDDLKHSGTVNFDIQWRTFSLEQNNSQKGPDFKFWEHPDTPSIGVRALAASKAVLKQGELAFLSFHQALFKARHVDRKKIGNPEVLSEIANACGIDVNRLEKDLTEKECWAAVGHDHEEAREIHNLFGVPTLIFPKGRPVYIKLTSIPKSEDEQASLFNLIKDMAEDRPYLMELKRPDPIML